VFQFWAIDGWSTGRYRPTMAFEPVVVSAADGPMPQTRDQMAALKAQGATSIEVQLTHTDVVEDSELLELVELEIRDLAEQQGLTVSSITRSSSSGIYGPPS
jgi:translation elongation factor EF-Tu-like GTPase